MADNEKKRSKRRGLPVFLRYIIAAYLIYLGVLLIRNTITEQSSFLYLLAGIAVIAVGVVYLILTTRWLILDMEERREERERIEKLAAQEDDRDLLDDSDNPFA